MNDDKTLMRFYVAKSTEEIPLYGGITLDYSTTPPGEKVDIYEEEWDIDFNADNNIIMDMWAACNSIIDDGDYDFLDINQCNLLKNWLLEQMKKDNLSAERLQQYNSLLKYVNSALSYNIGLGMECSYIGFYHEDDI